MIVVLQRVSEASVTIGGVRKSEIGLGLLALVCAEPGDTPETIAKLAAKTSKLRIFADENGRMNRSVRDVGGQALVVSQFTLAADVWSGNRPSFMGAAKPEEGEKAYMDFVRALEKEGVPCGTGEFGADMKVALLNDGPATFLLKL